MPEGKYFAYAAELLKVNPPHFTDEPIIAQLKKIGIEPGKSFDIDKLDPAVRKGLANVAEDAQQLMKFQNESPGKDKEANWLPAPKGAFNLTMRLYAPKAEALTGKWNAPPVMRVQ